MIGASLSMNLPYLPSLKPKPSGRFINSKVEKNRPPCSVRFALHQDQGTAVWRGTTVELGTTPLDSTGVLVPVTQRVRDPPPVDARARGRGTYGHGRAGDRARRGRCFHSRPVDGWQRPPDQTRPPPMPPPPQLASRDPPQDRRFRLPPPSRRWEGWTGRGPSRLVCCPSSVKPVLVAPTTHGRGCKCESRDAMNRPPPPAAIYTAADIRRSRLQRDLTGQLHDLSSLLKLQVLDLSTNSFSGAFPVWIGMLSGLTELGLGENSFDEAGVPESIGLLKNLTWLFLGQCNLRGEIPASVFHLESLGTLDFSRNQMTGVFPKAISNLRNLWKIELYQNNLTGEIPPELAHLTLLSEFDVSQNQLTGVLPKEIASLKKLKVFHIYRNNFYGELPAGLGDWEFLESFSTYENQFSGKFPANLGRFSPLNAIDISENYFTGEFPKFLCQSNKLQFLLALSNNFSGEFPTSYSSCKTLERFRVSQNQFSGSIPHGMWGLPNAVIIDVANNGFTGGISSDISISATLTQLLLQNNNFSSELPVELGNLSQLQKLVASNNRFSGQIPAQIGLRISTESKTPRVVMTVTQSGLPSPSMREGSIHQLLCRYPWLNSSLASIFSQGGRRE
ncbi:hypothetical protein ZWY2020_030626 [Hordeum vulgare]|nr:hypothetical protein ZWY2020_030626 [Hordeum vulgare]